MILAVDEAKLFTMRNKLVHICIKSGTELLHRVDEDYRCAITKMAIAAYSTGSDIFAYSAMSNHDHIIGQFQDPVHFVSIYRNSYSKWFNYKYKRSGRLGESHYYAEPLDDFERKLKAVNYVLRNPVHHSATDTPFSYDYCSARYVFASSLFGSGEVSWRRMTPYLSKNRALPSKYRLDNFGMVYPPSFLDIAAVENLYVTPKNYLYLVGRPSYSDVSKDEDAGILTLGELEPGENVELLYRNERHRSVAGSLTDIGVCGLIEGMLPPGRTYCHLSDAEKGAIANELHCRYYIPWVQLRRCLASG